MLVLGIDEAGRGPVVGSMMIAGVLADEDKLEELKSMGCKDSKMLSPSQREQIGKKIEITAKEIRLVEITANQIDSMRRVMSLNEIEARKIAELIEKFENKPDKVIIDCPDPEPSRFLARLRKYLDVKDYQFVIEHKADVNYPIVSAASIMAKLARDMHVKELGEKYGLKLGTGYSHDEEAIKAIENFLEKDGKLPPFVRKSWETSKRIVEKKEQKKLSDF